MPGIEEVSDGRESPPSDIRKGIYEFLNKPKEKTEEEKKREKKEENEEKEEIKEKIVLQKFESFLDGVLEKDLQITLKALEDVYEAYSELYEVFVKC